MDTPLISVIIPNYNHARFLDERIQSVLNQTYQNFEVIILDDKSTDNSIEVINQYKDNPHISHVVINDTNSGSPFKQWKKGIELAKGEWIWIAESDDICESVFLEKLVANIDSNRNCVVSFCKSFLFDENGFIRNQPNLLKDGIYESMDFISAYLSRGTIISNASSAIFKREIAMAIDDEYMNYKGAGDRLFWIKMIENGNVAYLSEPLNHFRQHKNNSTEKNYQNGVNQLEDKRILDYIYDKGYISLAFYDTICYEYVWNHILNLDNKKLQNSLISKWNDSVLFKWKIKIRYNMIKATEKNRLWKSFYHFLYVLKNHKSC